MFTKHVPMMDTLAWLSRNGTKFERLCQLAAIYVRGLALRECEIWYWKAWSHNVNSKRRDFAAIALEAALSDRLQASDKAASSFQTAASC